MSHTDRLKRSAGTFRQLTGITPAAFDRLLTELVPRYAAADARRKDRPGRRRKPKAGRKHAVSPAFPGRVHDKKVYDRTRAVGPPGARRTGDTGYVGTALDSPARRPPGGALTARQKAGNRRLSRRRIAAEHGIGKMKVWRIA